ncbi:MAG: hypothetical protein AB7J28_04625 [Hyphomonadaceae bacterium]
MKHLLAAILAAAMAGTALAQQNYTSDARSVATDEQIRVSRRAYRAECQRHQPLDYCDCMTGGMAQALEPRDLDVATRMLAHRLTGAPAPAGLSAASVRAAEAATEEFEQGGCLIHRR